MTSPMLPPSGTGPDGRAALGPAPGGPVPAPGGGRAQAAGRNPVAWWGFGLAFGSVLAALAGAALALSVLGIVVARRTGRALVPAIVGCVIATLALGAHAVAGTVGAVQWVTAAVAEDDTGSGGDSGSGSGDGGDSGSGDGSDEGGSDEGDGDGGVDLTTTEQDYLDALYDLESSTYAVYTDDALLFFGEQACDSLVGGLTPADAALDLDLMGSAGAEDVVATAGRVLCPDGSVGGASGASAGAAQDA